jgi:hypothetical protein
MVSGLDKRIYWVFDEINMQVVDYGNLDEMASFEKAKATKQP